MVSAGNECRPPQWIERIRGTSQREDVRPVVAEQIRDATRSAGPHSHRVATGAAVDLNARVVAEIG